MIEKILDAMLDPSRIILKAWKAVPRGGFQLRLRYDIFPRPQYAYCLYQGARLAKQLGIDRISALEFGVAGGDGLLELENLAVQIERELGMHIDIYGFDTGTGLPQPVDYRDMPYIWSQGFFNMDLDALRRRLRRSQLILGDVHKTVPQFLSSLRGAPICAVMLDLDYYSSTRDALRIFDGAHDTILPRVFCYLDDIISSDIGIMSDSVGQLLAIQEFNESHELRDISPVAGLRHGRRIPAKWNDQIYVHHAFDHPDYCTFVYPEKDRQLPLASR